MNTKMKTQYKTETQAYHAPNDTDVDSFCIDIMFLNLCANTVYINGFPVANNATLEVNGNEGEINTTKYKIGFNGQTTGTVHVARRKYLI